ncbi:hypothetical protein SX4_3387 [Vibrio mimicus SX-4]|nr:hypothetical protein SX4_3387 [Vibrio mimicus SX-4]ERM54827.1 hypothetical protein P781_12675 [Vibrio mimicus CAIM 1883]
MTLFDESQQIERKSNLRCRALTGIKGADLDKGIALHHSLVMSEIIVS